MNDLDLIRELRPDVQLPDAGELASARRQLSVAITTEIRAESVPGARRSWSPRRLTLAGGAATAVAAGVAAALIIAPGHRAQPSTGPVAGPGHRAQPGTGPAVPPGPLTGDLTAAHFLDAAARALRQQSAAAPRPGQFVYAETEGQGGRSKYQIWQSADGTKAGLVVNSQGPPSSLPSCSLAQATATHCVTTAGYLPGMPTQPGAVLAYLTRIGLIQTAGHPAIANWVANDLGKEVDSLLSNTYLLPAQRAALFEFMARTAGFTEAPHAVDALGRRGIGIAWNYEGGEAMIIFNPATYAYLGDRTWAPGGAYARDYAGAALVKFKIVNSLPAKILAAIARQPAPSKG